MLLIYLSFIFPYSPQHEAVVTLLGFGLKKSTITHAQTHIHAFAHACAQAHAHAHANTHTPMHTHIFWLRSSTSVVNTGTWVCLIITNKRGRKQSTESRDSVDTGRLGLWNFIDLVFAVMFCKAHTCILYHTQLSLKKNLLVPANAMCQSWHPVALYYAVWHPPV